MRFACWVTKFTDRRAEYVMLSAVPRQQWPHERVSLLRYTFNTCLVRDPFLLTVDYFEVENRPLRFFDL
jgi:hypothetical protein